MVVAHSYDDPALSPFPPTSTMTTPIPLSRSKRPLRRTFSTRPIGRIVGHSSPFPVFGELRERGVSRTAGKKDKMTLPPLFSLLPSYNKLFRNVMGRWVYLTREYRARSLAVSYLSSPWIYEPHLTNLTAALLIVPHPLGQVNGSL